jgi:hypothetical protein
MKLPAAAFVILLATIVPSIAEYATVQIPSIGCPSDGQMGPQPARHDGFKSLPLDPRLASRLAFYEADDETGVLGPRGWHCVLLEGSSGNLLVVTPAPLKPEDLFPDKVIRGPAIQRSFSLGGTSGRFDVAQAIARYFPARKIFLDSVLAERIWPRASFPRGLYRADRLLFRSPFAVEFETPAHARGLGADSRLIPDGLPIRAVASLVDRDSPDGPNLLELDIRLPPDSVDLLRPIIQQAFPDISLLK